MWRRATSEVGRQFQAANLEENFFLHLSPLKIKKGKNDWQPFTYANEFIQLASENSLNISRGARLEFPN